MSINLALHQPALQSSDSRWLPEPTGAEDARVATNGDTSSRRSFCTDDEACPLWQIDLGDGCIVEGLRIFNLVPHYNRLMRCIMLVLGGD